ncbi:MAG: cell division protein ZapA [Rickettsiales bacterium]|jgi:cell division protein ZapA (FtsZ GTPase activity inhibitor)|nr:cell division protein ZapA [Rickettsiales bacterium]
MSNVNFSINAKLYSVECPMGQEAYIKSLASLVDARVKNLAQAFRGADAETLLLMAAVMSAGEIEKLKFRIAELETAKKDGAGVLEDELAGAISDIAAKIASAADSLDEIKE